MATIVTRAGKGSPLTNNEVDANFVNLNNDKLEVTTAASTYAPLTGTGASGTWNISITGNAATVTNGVYTTGDQTIGGTKTFSSTITGSISGNAGTVTNGVYTTGSYANPSWITSLAETKVLPSQTGNNGLYLTTNGTSTSWAAVPSPNNGTLTLAVSGTGLSGSQTFTANQSSNATFTVTSNATDANTASTIVARDASGNFSAGTITATLNGNASTATSATSATSATTATTATNWGSYGAVPTAGVVPGANGIARADASGYTYFTYINSSSANTENPTVSQVVVTNGTDGFYRKASIAHLTSAVATNASGTWGISISGNAATVTNGVYTTGTQTISGDKTFSSLNNRIGATFIGSNEVYLYENATNSCTLRTGAAGSYKYVIVAANGDVSTGANITASGNITANSDERLKTNIQTIDNALGKVESVRGVTYTRKSDGSAGIGVIAQEIQKVAPEAVLVDNEGIMSVAYGNLVGLLIEAVKELSLEIKELKQKVGE